MSFRKIFSYRLQKTYKNLFWSLFGYPDVLTGGMIVVDNSEFNATERVSSLNNAYMCHNCYLKKSKPIKTLFHLYL